MARLRGKTEFGKEIALFSLQTNLSIKDIAKACEIKYGTLIDTTTGRTAGHEVIPKVREFMGNYKNAA